MMQYVPLSPAERPEFEKLEASLRREVNPKGVLQESVFRDLAAAAWKRAVVNRLLAESCQSTAALFSDEIDGRVRLLQRHKNEQDRAFHRALRLLKELQTTDLLRAAALQNPDVDPETCPGLADFAKVTKQSRARAARMANTVREDMAEFEDEAKLVQEEFLRFAQERNFAQRPEAA